MDSDRLQQFRHKLEVLRLRLAPEVAAIAERTREGSTGQADGQLSNVPMHLGDFGTDEYLYDLNATLLENEAYLLGEVHEALDRIDNGTYGICQHCGRPIAKERLEALPYVRFCVKCADHIHDTPEANLDRGRP